MGTLEGKVAFITGVARGQGRAHAVRLAKEGAAIIGVDILSDVATMEYPMASQADLDQTALLVTNAGGRALLTRADVRDRDALDRAVSDGIAEFGRLDVVCANAGIAPPAGPVWTITAKQWQDVIDINLTGVFNTLSVTIPAIRAAGNGGSIIITASGAAIRSAPHLADYNASKHGALGLAQTAANELAAEDIRVNVIAPGTVGTPMVTTNAGLLKAFRPDLADPTLQDCLPIFESMGPMGRPWVDVEDIANAAAFLASDAARYITGIVMPVDQGSVNRVL